MTIREFIKGFCVVVSGLALVVTLLIFSGEPTISMSFMEEALAKWNLVSGFAWLIFLSPIELLLDHMIQEWYYGYSRTH